MGNRKYNVLLITSDQWRADCLSAFGHPCVKTPNFDALMADGIAFQNHYTVCAPCGPSRASLLTGMYMQNHRSVRNGTPLDDRHTNIAREARLAGYQPKLFGYTDTSLDPRSYQADEVMAVGYESMLPGFDEGVLLPSEEPQPWLDYLKHQGYDFSDADDALRPVDADRFDYRRSRTNSSTRYAAEHSQTAFLTQRALDYIEEAEAGWFAHLSYLRPHSPFVAPEPYNRMVDPDDVPMPARASTPSIQSQQHPWLATAMGPNGDWVEPWMYLQLGSAEYDAALRKLRATYYGLVSKVDHYIGRVIEQLKASGEYENTLIILTSDHGEQLGDQWLFNKRSYFDASYHIPLIMKVPGHDQQRQGKLVDAFTESVDIMPTVLETLGLDIPRQCDGQSLLPFVDGNKPDNWRGEVHWEYDYRDVCDDQLERELGVTMDQSQFNVIRDKHYKYIYFNGLHPLLFDLSNDPSELNNLADDPDYANIMLEYAQKLLSWRMMNDERTLTHIKVSRKQIHHRRCVS